MDKILTNNKRTNATLKQHDSGIFFFFFTLPAFSPMAYFDSELFMKVQS
jgi:hypothetical protein